MPDRETIPSDDVRADSVRQGMHRPTSTLIGYLFISPWLIGFGLLVGYPFVASLYWSFCRYDLLSPPEWVGTEHYRRIAREFITGDGVALALWNTAYYACLAVPLSVVMGVALAIVLSWPFRGRTFVRTICFLPSVVPVVASSILWMWLLDPRRGIVNRILSRLQMSPPGWLTDYREAAWLPGWWSGNGGFGSKDALVLMAVWSVGNMMLIYLAALGDVPRELHEAAAMDGAGRVRRFWQITLPMLSPVILFHTVMGLIQSVQVFTQMYVVSEGTGAPERSLLVLSLYMFLTAFQDLNMGYASAIAWVTFAFLVVATWMLFRGASRWVFYERSL